MTSKLWAEAAFGWTVEFYHQDMVRMGTLKKLPSGGAIFGKPNTDQMVLIEPSSNCASPDLGRLIFAAATLVS